MDGRLMAVEMALKGKSPRMSHSDSMPREGPRDLTWLGLTTMAISAVVEQLEQMSYSNDALAFISNTRWQQTRTDSTALPKQTSVRSTRLRTHRRPGRLQT